MVRERIFVGDVGKRLQSPILNGENLKAILEREYPGIEIEVRRLGDLPITEITLKKKRKEKMVQIRFRITDRFLDSKAVCDILDDMIREGIKRLDEALEEVQNNPSSRKFK